MAKRKRLTPAQPGYLDRAQPGYPDGAQPGYPDGFPPEGQRAPETKAMPLGGPVRAPIAQVAGEAAAGAALAELSAVLHGAREDGRLIEILPLAAVDDGYLVRDRLEQDEDEMAALMDSIRARGQQTAIEAIRLPDRDGAPAWGLISGWRRLTALRRLHAETGAPRFAGIRARVVRPDTAQDAYVAMVEENEIRVNLSFYERARIVLRALRAGVYDSQRAALQGLFGATTRSKRSKIGTFMAVVEAFDGDLKHPTAISEKLGLALARELVRDPDFVSRVRSRLASAPDRTAGEEVRLLVLSVETQHAAPEPAPEPAPRPAPEPEAASNPPAPPRLREYVAPGVSLSFHPGRGRIELTGPNVDAGLAEALRAWFADR